MLLGSFPYCENRRGFNFVGTNSKFRSSITVQSFAKFIQRAIIVGGNITFKETQIACSLPSFFGPLEALVHVSFAPLTPERTHLTKVYQRYFTLVFFCQLEARRLSQRLNHGPKRYTTIGLHLLISGCSHTGGSEKARTRLSFVYRHVGSSRNWLKSVCSCPIARCKTGSIIESVVLGEWTRKRLRIVTLNRTL